MSIKTYFLSPELIPFCETGILAHYSKNIPIKLQGMGHDIRITTPKYGFISERKYILREVIRLREILTDIGGSDVLASAKSAFIPQTRVQVYFMEHSEWFQPLNPLLYKAKNGRPYPDNDDRFGFFGKIGLEMLVNLFWSPDIIICNGWQSSFVPILYDQLYRDKDFYKEIKTVQVIHSIDDYSNVSRSTYEKIGVKLPDNFTGESLNCQTVAAHFADVVVAFDNPEFSVSKELSTNSDFKASNDLLQKKLKTVTLKDTSDESWTALAEEFNEILQN